MNALVRKIASCIKARPAVLLNRDGTEEIVSLLCKTGNGNFYVFRYPYQPHDCGREVSPRYLRNVTLAGHIYTFLAVKAITIFPNWVKV